VEDLKYINMRYCQIYATKIDELLSNLEEAEFIYLQQKIAISLKVKKLISNNNLSEEKFCELMEIDISSYEDFVSGSYTYTLLDIAQLDTLIRVSEKGIVI
jgi:predicted XRE-type DNA-binding protein